MSINSTQRNLGFGCGNCEKLTNILLETAKKTKIPVTAEQASQTVKASVDAFLKKGVNHEEAALRALKTGAGFIELNNQFPKAAKFLGKVAKVLSTIINSK